MAINSRHFGSFKGEEVLLHTLENDNGMSVSLMNYGATITSIKIPDSSGVIEDICCGFDLFKGYFSEVYTANAPYFGGTVGRYCSQLKDAKFILNGQEYNLAKNCGENNLHGGNQGFDKKVWKVRPFSSEKAQLQMELRSHHLEEGFPGNAKVSVTFTLNKDNELHINYRAISDQDTPFAITNHSYFNLSGFKNSIAQHTIKINSGKRQLWDTSGAATGEEISVQGKPDDLRLPVVIQDAQELMGDGFEHYYLFEEKGFDLDKVAEICDVQSGRSLEIVTTEPGMLFYTGKYTSDELRRETGEKYGRYRGFCCETHRYPNGPNIAKAPGSILKKDEIFESTTIYKFKW